MDIIDAQTVVVYNHPDLNTALSNDNGFVYVHLGASFALTAGIRIYPGKPSLVIDGIDPRDLTQTIHTLTDFNSSSSTGCLYVDTASDIQIVLQNIILMGRNYYGMPRISDSVGNEDVSVSYHNVTYTGPQMTWNPRGLTRYVDCDITIVPGYSPAEEVAEVSRVELGGVTSINQNNNTPAFPIFQYYSRSTPSLTILADADVTITSANNFFSSPVAISTVLQQRAKLNLSTQRSISLGTAASFNSFHLQEDAVFNYTRLGSGGLSNTLYMSGAITLENGADFMMVADFASSSGSLLYFATGVSGITLNSPKRFALYNSGTSTTARPFYFAATTNFSFIANQIDYWQSATPYPGAGTFDDPAPLRWHRPEWGIFSVSGTATNTAGTGTVITDTNLTTDEQALLPPLSDMQLRQAKVFSVGVLPLTVNTIVGDLRPVTGTSLPSSDIQVSYTLESLERHFSGSCGTTGNYTVSVADPIPVDTGVTVASNLRFLLTETTLMAVEAGELGIYEAPGLITFTFNSISQNPVILPRALPEDPVIISDDRVDVDRTTWVVWVKIDGPLRTASGLTLPESVIFVRKGETTPVTLTESYISVHTDGPYDIVEFPIVWDNTEGVLARITGPIRVHETYSALLTWLVLPEGVPPEEDDD